MKISKSAIFLFELMFVILIFTISAAICTNIFAMAFNYSTDSRDLTNAVLRAESAAEEFKAAPGPGGEQTIYYDNEWHEISDELDAVYLLTLKTGTDGSMYTAAVTVTKNKGEGKEIFRLDAVKYGKSH